ncbi:MAG: VOC family protein [Anaerolineaceae bacterium]|nr:VOC family protein [Anaerolineaceae bacterium]
MQKITPFLWFNDQAEEAIQFYTSIFENSRIESITRFGDEVPGPKGKVITATFQLAGQEFMALNGGPEFTFTPATSFFVICQTEGEIDALWQKLTQEGAVLMELAKYPFSEKYGWVQDKYNLSWQLNLGGQAQKIVPFLMFVGDQAGKTDEAIHFYASLFQNSGIARIERTGQGEGEPAGAVKHAAFSLSGQDFMAMDSYLEHAFSFTEAVSFFVNCETQHEVDEMWTKLTAGGEEGQCGWLKDKFGVSWQIVPTILGKLMNDPHPEKSKRVTQAMLQMKKIDIAGLQRAYEQG